MAICGILQGKRTEKNMKDNDMILTNVERRENVFLSRVYLNMMLALLVTGVVAFLTAQSTAIMKVFVMNPVAMVVIAIVEMGLVMYLSGRVERMSVGSAYICFYLYAILTGFTFSVIVTAYARTFVIAKAFMPSGVVFGLAAIYGAITKKSLKGWINWLMMALVGLLITTIVNIFLLSPMVDILVSGLGVVLFTLLTAWDSQKLTSLNRSYGSSMSSEDLQKISIMGALDLYLDFINIFLYFVRLFGRSNDR